jgi:hypothetical protein
MMAQRRGTSCRRDLTGGVVAQRIDVAREAIEEAQTLVNTRQNSDLVLRVLDLAWRALTDAGVTREEIERSGLHVTRVRRLVESTR